MPTLCHYYFCSQRGKSRNWNRSLKLEQIILEKSFLSVNKNPLNNPFPFYLIFGMWEGQTWTGKERGRMWREVRREARSYAHREIGSFSEDGCWEDKIKIHYYFSAPLCSFLQFIRACCQWFSFVTPILDLWLSRDHYSMCAREC